MKSLATLFECLGGTNAVAALLAIKVSTASEMKRRGSVPVRHWPRLITAAKAKGIKLDSAALLAMHTKDAA